MNKKIWPEVEYRAADRFIRRQVAHYGHHLDEEESLGGGLEGLPGSGQHLFQGGGLLQFPDVCGILYRGMPGTDAPEKKCAHIPGEPVIPGS